MLQNSLGLDQVKGLCRVTSGCSDSRAGLVHWPHSCVIQPLWDWLLQGIASDGLQDPNHGQLLDLWVHNINNRARNTWRQSRLEDVFFVTPENPTTTYRTCPAQVKSVCTDISASL